MVNITDKSQCTGCNACSSICAHNAISMQHDEYGHIYPKVDLNACTDCGLCEKVCPLLHKDRLPKDDDLEHLPVKAVYNRDSEVRKRSTSGGTFSLLAEYVIAQGGIVCAARFDEHYHIHHAFFDNMDDIDAFRGSKYAQSDLSDVFRQIKAYLKSRPVLFVGSPCQVAGLKSYLIKEYDNLYTCDFICMSISSGKMWDEYISQYQSAHPVKRIFFKDKRNGWHKGDWRMLIEDNEGEHLCSANDNPYFWAYLQHYSARPSCFDCAVRHCRHVSDFTIADCWGIDKINPSFDDNKGCTTLILQSEKSKVVFDAIKDKTCYTDFGIQNVRIYNKHIENQAAKPQDYDSFCEAYKQAGFMRAITPFWEKQYKTSVLQKVKKFIKKHIR